MEQREAHLGRGAAERLRGPGGQHRGPWPPAWPAQAATVSGASSLFACFVALFLCESTIEVSWISPEHGAGPRARETHAEQSSSATICVRGSRCPVLSFSSFRAIFSSQAPTMCSASPTFQWLPSERKNEGSNQVLRRRLAVRWPAPPCRRARYPLARRGTPEPSTRRSTRRCPGWWRSPRAWCPSTRAARSC